MNTEEYEVMINDLIADFTEVIFAAAERNHYKDERKYWRYSDSPPAIVMVKGWVGFDLKDKLKEEVDEVLENPSHKEIGDVAWVLAMMLDQLNTRSPTISLELNNEKGEK